MWALRILFVSLSAPIAACAILSLIIEGTIEPASFLPLMFALPGSVLVLNASYIKLSDRFERLAGRYILMAAIGTVAGAIMSGFTAPGQLLNLGLGALYGFSTALCWIALHALTRKWSKT